MVGVACEAMIWVALLVAIAIGLLVVGRLIGMIRRLQQVNGELRASVDAMQSSIAKHDDQITKTTKLAARNRTQVDEVRGRTTKLREDSTEIRQRTTKLRDEAEQRNIGQQRLNSTVRDGVQDAKDRGALGIKNSRSLSGELIHGSLRFVEDKDRALLLDDIAPTLGLDWVTERHLLYLEHCVPVLEGRLRGRLAAPTAAMVLRSLVVMAAPDPTRVLEIGTLYGHSAAYLHEVARHRKTGFHQTIIDPFFGYYGEDNPDLFTPIPVIADVFRDNMRRVGATDEDVEIVVGLAEADEIRHQMSDREFEVLVIDGDHSFEGVKRDFENYADHVVPGGYIIIDDYQGPSWPDVTRFVDETVFTDPRFEMVSGHLRTAVVRRHLDT